MLSKYKTIPKYSRYMYLNGYDPYTILRSARMEMLDNYIKDFNEDSEDDNNEKETVLTIKSEIKTQ